MTGLRRVAAGAAAAVLVSAVLACPSGGREGGLNVSTIPPAFRDDYAVFAERCSKCHSLSRPLESGIDDDIFWRAYVERMRRQPSSGISIADETPILRFLHYYSVDRRRPTPTPGEDGG